MTDTMTDSTTDPGNEEEINTGVGYDIAYLRECASEFHDICEYWHNVYGIFEELVKGHIANKDPDANVYFTIDRIAENLLEIEDKILYTTAESNIKPDRKGLKLASAKTWLRDPQRTTLDDGYDDLCVFLKKKKYCQNGEELQEIIETYDEHLQTPYNYYLPDYINKALFPVFNAIYTRLYKEMKYMIIASHAMPSTITGQEIKVAEYNAHRREFLLQHATFDECCRILMKKLDGISQGDLRKINGFLAMKQAVADIFLEMNDEMRKNDPPYRYHKCVIERIKKYLRTLLYDISYFFTKNFPTSFFIKLVRADIDNELLRCEDYHTAKDCATMIRDLKFFLITYSLKEVDCAWLRQPDEYFDLWRDIEKLEDINGNAKIRDVFIDVKENCEALFSILFVSREALITTQKEPFDIKKLKFTTGELTNDTRNIVNDKVVTIFPTDIRVGFDHLYQLHLEAQKFSSKTRLYDYAQLAPLDIFNALDDDGIDSLKMLYKTLLSTLNNTMDTAYEHHEFNQMRSNSVLYMRMVLNEMMDCFQEGNWRGIQYQLCLFAMELTKVLKKHSEICLEEGFHLKDFKLKVPFKLKK